MEIRGKKVIVFGGAGLVGRAICRRLLEGGVKSVVVASLLENEAIECVNELKKEFPEAEYTAEWGDIFVRYSMKNLKRREILADSAKRMTFIDDIVNPLNREILTESTIFQMLTKHTPDIVIDSINTASIIAYQNVYGVAREVTTSLKEMNDKTREMVEKLICTQYIPQLIRHVQIFLQSMVETKVKFYLKIGTCGTGGMGLNIPYTHSEDRPSQMLLSKSAVAGAHSLLLFLMARTPGGPIIKELKPAAAIAWKKIVHGPVVKKGEKVLLENVSMKDVVNLTGILPKRQEKKPTYFEKNGKPCELEAPYIDTGENGLFSLGEFEALTDEGQMEFITPEEIAKSAAWEITSLNTGHDIVAAFDNSILGPTYRAGYMRQGAIAGLKKLVRENQTDSVAFEALGPPRLSKLLYEAYLLRECFGVFDAALKEGPERISKKLEDKITSDENLRSRIVSIGIPILLSSGTKLLRGSHIAIPADIPGLPDIKFEVSAEQIDKWAHDGWVDLRPQNMGRWQARFKTIKATVESIPAGDTSSAFTKGRHYWQDEDGHYPISFAKLTSWIFINEDQGVRMK